MKTLLIKKTLTFYLTLVLLIGFALPFTPPVEAAQTPPADNDFAREALKQRALDAYLQLPLYFIANQGQQDESVVYYAQGGRHSIYFTAEEMVTALDETILRMRFVGAKATPPLGAGKTTARVNYFIGKDPARWQTDIPTYGEVVYHQLYPGIDLHYAGRNGALKYTFVVQPGADLSQIRLAFGGASGLRLDEAGNLLILAAGNELKDTKPYAYQEIGGRRVEVETEFVLRGVRTCGFAVQSDYDPRYPLVIDPTLKYSTYLGGNDNDWGNDIAVDGAGNAYVTGLTLSSNFPIWNAYWPIRAGAYDAFVTRIDTTQSGLASLVYSTYLGGNGDDAGHGIAVDEAGHAYVTGYTQSINFPIQNPYDNRLDTDITGKNKDAFVTKLNTTGNALVYSTYLGGNDKDGGDGIAVDGIGYAYVTGYTKSTDFPLQNAYQNRCEGCPEHGDAFVTKLHTAGNSLVYSTYLGGNMGAGAQDIAVDGAGYAYVIGSTGSTDFPTCNAYQQRCSGCPQQGDVFVTKLHPTGSALFYSTYLGGSDSDWGYSIAADGAGNAYVMGLTSSSNFPTQNAYQPTKAGDADAFVTKLSATGNALFYSTYLGGDEDDCKYHCAIAVDEAGHAYVTGHTESIDFPIQDAYQAANAGGNEVFVTKFNAAGNALIYSTYLGGSTHDFGYGIAVDEASHVYVTGHTNSINFPIQNPYQGIYGSGNYDALVAMFLEERFDLSTSSKQVSPATIVPTGTVTHTLSYTITLANTGNLAASTAYLTDTLPPALNLTVNPTCPGGGTCSYNASSHTVTWTGSLAPGASALINYAGLVNVPIGTEDTMYFVNTALVDDGKNAPLTLRAQSAVNPYYSHLPLIRRR